MKALQPRIILARISTFGPDGPYAHRLGFDTVAQAMSGAMSMTGFPGTPIRAIVPYCDYGTALHTVFGVMVALWERERTGIGQIVDGSLLASGVTFIQALLAERSVLGIERTQRGNAAIYAAPSDTWPTRDGWVLVATIGSDMFARWARMIGHAELIDDPDFKDDMARGDQYQRIGALMEQWLACLIYRGGFGALGCGSYSRRTGAESWRGAGGPAGEGAAVAGVCRISRGTETCAASEHGCALVGNTGRYSSARSVARRTHG